MRGWRVLTSSALSSLLAAVPAGDAWAASPGVDASPDVTLCPAAQVEALDPRRGSIGPSQDLVAGETRLAATREPMGNGSGGDGYGPSPTGDEDDVEQATVTGDVDVYDVPGGEGHIVGMLEAGTTVRSSGCKEDNWCEVVGSGWVWGDFLRFRDGGPPAAAGHGFRLGVNLSGGEFGEGRGRYGETYVYPDAGELDYFAAKGLRLVRLPFMWEHVQPVLFGDLDPTELGRLAEVLDEAAARRVEVVLDMHNFGRYDDQAIGSAAVPVAAFADVWRKLAAAFRDHPAVWAYGLMNEPHDMGDARVWPAAAQAAVDAVRSVDMEHTVAVPGDGWSGAWTWQEINAALSVADPADRIVYEAHQYFDRSGGGEYGSYDAEGAYPDIGVDRLQPFVQWLEARGARGYVGEFGVPDDDPRWLEVLDRFVAALSEHDLPGTYWSAGPWWDDYPLSVEPRGGRDRPQLGILVRHIGGS